MAFYYAENRQQIGPISEEEFQRRIDIGVIGEATLVWRPGMAGWQTLRDSGIGRKAAEPPPAPSLPPLSPSDPATRAEPSFALPGGSSVVGIPNVLCSECGGLFPEGETIPHGKLRICFRCKPVFLQKLKQGVRPKGHVEYAGFWIRVAAKVLDSIITAVPLLLLFFGAGFLSEFQRAISGAGPNPVFSPILTVLIYVVAFGVQGTYTIGFVWKYGATPGKMVCRLKIVNADGHGRIGFGKCVGRYFGEMVSGLICYIGYLLLLGDEERRTLHDRMAGTRVIRT